MAELLNLLVGGVVQGIFASADSVGSSHRQKLEAESACQTNQHVTEQYQLLQQSLSVGLQSEIVSANLQNTAADWAASVSDEEQRATLQENAFMNAFTLFLVCLGIVTGSLMIALLIKGGRLQRLFSKVARIRADEASAAQAA
jgi:hypothetical protein